MSKSITREEIFLNSIANSQGSNLTPITREEQYLSYIAGETNTYPIQPITRKEQLLSKIAQNGIGGGSGVNIQTLIANENGTYTAPQGVAYSPVIVQVQSQSGGGDEPSVAKYDANGYRTITEVTAEDLAEVTEIGSYAFFCCDGLTNVVISDSVTSIGKYAFSGCAGLTSAVIGNNTTVIKEFAFQGCTSLASIIIPDSVTSIEGSALRGTAVSDIIIPDSVTSIGGAAFYGCGNLKRVIVNAKTPPTIQSTTFMQVPADCAFYVPAASVDAYKAATNWSARADYIFPIEE